MVEHATNTFKLWIIYKALSIIRKTTTSHKNRQKYKNWTKVQKVYQHAINTLNIANIYSGFQKMPWESKIHQPFNKNISTIIYIKKYHQKLSVYMQKYINMKKLYSWYQTYLQASSSKMHPKYPPHTCGKTNINQTSFNTWQNLHIALHQMHLKK